MNTSVIQSITAASIEEFVQRAVEPPAEDSEQDVVLCHVLHRSPKGLVWLEQTKFSNYGEDCYWENIYLHGCEINLGQIQRSPVWPDNDDVIRKARRAVDLGLEVTIPKPTYSQPAVPLSEAQLAAHAANALQKSQWDFFETADPVTINMRPIKMRPWLDRYVRFLIPTLPAGVQIESDITSSGSLMTAIDNSRDRRVPDKISIAIQVNKYLWAHKLVNDGKYTAPSRYAKQHAKALAMIKRHIPAIHKAFSAYVEQWWEKKEKSRHDQERRQLAEFFQVAD